MAKEVYTIIDPQQGSDRKSYWLKIGSAFTNKDGSLNVLLNCLPLNGRLHVRDKKPKDNGDPEDGE